jgi:hypothetical protein
MVLEAGQQDIDFVEEMLKSMISHDRYCICSVTIA